MLIENRVTPSQRLSALCHAIDSKGFVRIMEAHSGLSAIVGETARVTVGDEVREYDGLWESSLTDSATKGIPDASIIGNESRLHTIDEILYVTEKPLIVDGDTGGEIAQFEYFVRHLEQRGVSAVIIEDKVFPKRNSLDASASQDLEDPEKFAEKIQAGKNVTISDDFMIIARLESLIAGAGLQDALQRAERYIIAGVDGIMIHSGQREPDELFAFARAFDGLCERLGRRPVLVSVPTTYNHHDEEELVGLGFNVIIYANQLLRAAHRAMKEAANRILEDGRSLRTDEICSPVKEVFSVVGFDKITAKDRERNVALRLPTIIPAAGRDPVFPEQPKSLISVAGRRILDHQLESIRKAGLKKVVIVRGHEGGQFESYYATDENFTFSENPLYAERHAMHSLMQASNHMEDGFVLVFSDILFDHEILMKLINSGKDIVLGLDNSYSYHQHEIDKKLDLVVTRRSLDANFRSLHRTSVTELSRMGKNIGIERADSEFIGIGYFSAEGAKLLRDVYDDCQNLGQVAFHEAADFSQASITDMFQEIIDRGFPIHGLEVSRGWREIHSREDVESAEAEIMNSLVSV